MALDSRVAFQQRAAQVDIPTADIDALEVTGGLTRSPNMHFAVNINRVHQMNVHW